MKAMVFVVALCLGPGLCLAQTPMQTIITPVPAAKPDDAAPSKLVIERPVPEGQDSIAPKPVPHMDTTADQAIRKDADAAISTRAAAVASDCDADFTARIDWTSISAEDIHLAMPENTCGAVLDALDEYCATSAGRERVAQSIKGVICTAGQAPGLAIHGGTLLYTLDWQSAHPAAAAYAWLAGHL